MAVELAEAYVSITASARGISKSITDELGDTDGVGRSAGDQASQGFMGKFKSGLTGVAAAVGGAFAAAKIADIVRSSIGAASDLNETTSKVGVIFGDAAGGVEDFASTADKALGQSKQQALDAAATFATFGKSAGLTGKDLAGFSTGLVGTSADLASFFNTSPEQAIDAIGSALRGESEPIRQYGILLDDATLRNRALKLGLISTTKEALTPQQKVMAAQAEILAQTTDAQGDFARTSEGAANKQRILSAEAKNASAEFGQALLPVYSAIVTILAEKVVPVIVKVSTFLSEHKGVATAAALVIGGVLVAAFVAWAISAAAAAVATLAAAAPFIAIGLAVAALAVGIIYAYNHFAIFRTIVDAAWQILQAVFGWVADHWQLVLGLLTGPIGLAVLLVIQHFDTIRDFIGGVISWIGDHWQLILAIITGPIGVAVLVVSSNIDSIVGFFTGIPGRIIGALTWIGDTIRGGIDAARDFMWHQIEAIVGYFLGIPGRLAGAFGGMFDGIKEAMRSALNGVIGLWNSVPDFHIPAVHVPGTNIDVGGATIGLPNISYLAAGGIVTRPTLAMLGEAGPEAVIPLGRGGVRDITINTLGKPDAAELAREVVWVMKTAGV